MKREKRTGCDRGRAGVLVLLCLPSFILRINHSGERLEGRQSKEEERGCAALQQTLSYANQREGAGGLCVCVCARDAGSPDRKTIKGKRSDVGCGGALTAKDGEELRELGEPTA